MNKRFALRRHKRSFGWGSALVLLFVSVGVIAPPAVQSAPAAFKNCKSFNKEYPKGVARGPVAAKRAEGRGNYRPVVRKKVFRAAVKANPKLGGPKDGTLCEVQKPKSPPGPPQALIGADSPSSPHSAVDLIWQPPADAGDSPVTSYVVSDGTREFVTAETSYTVTELAEESSFTFSVQAVSAIGRSEPAQVSASTEKARLQLPPNSGWVLKGGDVRGVYTSPATPGKLLHLGNAPALAIDLAGFTCSGEWYDSALITVEFVDANGAIVPHARYGWTSELLGYSVSTTDRISTGGCGSDTVDLSNYQSASHVRIVSNSGRSGSVSLYAFSRV